MVYDNLHFLQNALLSTQNINSWCLSTDMNLIYSNCHEENFFISFFNKSLCKPKIEEHFSNSTKPIITADSIGFVWIAVFQNTSDNPSDYCIHLLGPIFTSAITEKYMFKHIKTLNLSPDVTSRLWRFIKKVPTMSYEMASSFCSILNSCVNTETSLPEDIEIWREPIDLDEVIEWGSRQWHGDWAAEQQFIKSISEGRVVNLNNITTGVLGNIGGGDPLRQAKNMLIVFAVLCSRAAIIGGVSVEGSLSLSDFFIESAELAQTVSGVESIGLKMYYTYIDRVQKVQQNKKYSSLVQNCMEYVQTHIFEEITLKNISDAISYSHHHISHKFKEETGISLSNYINQQKIEMAKNLLKNSTISINELSARLGYTSPSYFGSIFKKNTGMTPAQFKNTSSTS